ncbi:hypothetical protein WOLCODRAFT_135558 [Wolfiporia cocos MD-104 SS10]|uniref:Uncharacterized protein n=1 Tax=Wolfiporia cocos (strain MD-104) TaxID=742152 RepID=A0A2H3J612_WOLCO|nr:hypothetical protein WOLCODRAFT_135558 [Wolfiporia cocos MD-104 SS10]
MAPEIKFTSYGIPYVVEFADVNFGSCSPASRTHADTPALGKKSSPVSNTSTSTLLGTIGSSATASSETLAYPEGDEGEGLFIQFASHLSRPHHKLSHSRLLRLKQRIAKAVLAAGMDAAPSTRRVHPMDIPRLSRLSRGSIQSTATVPEDNGGALFRGTYGQVMAALHAAGLVTTPCKESGVDEATRLGALFVARHTPLGTVEMTRLTLWA